jgi:hypothetical protein
MAASAGDIIRTAIQWFVDGTDEIVNVHTLRLISGAALGDDDAVMEAIVDILTNELYVDILNLMPDNVLGSSVEGFNLTDPTTMPPKPHAMNGAEVAGNAAARQLTALVCLNGPAPRRQGRSYLPIFSEAALEDDGTWNSGTITELLQYGALLLAPLSNTDLTIERVICHQDGSAPIIPTAGVVPVAPRTQRRRTAGFGS